jgi:hypothetical protein
MTATFITMRALGEGTMMCPRGCSGDMSNGLNHPVGLAVPGDEGRY